MGYSAGGDGAYQMAPRMADRWAAAAMMAGYPNDASPINLRNIGFTLHVGALDSAYHRNTIAVTYGKEIQKLQDADPGFYQYSVTVHAGKAHWMDQEDTVALPWMQAFTRKPYPKKVVWHQDTTVGTNSFPDNGTVKPVQGGATQFQFYWIALQEKKTGKPHALVTAEIKGQEIDIVNSNIDSLYVLLNDSLIDLNKSVTVLWQGKKIYAAVPPRTVLNLYQTTNDRGDRDYAFSARLKLAKSDPLAPVLQFSKQPQFQAGTLQISDLQGRVVRSAYIYRPEDAPLFKQRLTRGVYLMTFNSRTRHIAQKIFIDTDQELHVQSAFHRIIPVQGNAQEHRGDGF
jgi:hypothetical protein